MWVGEQKRKVEKVGHIPVQEPVSVSARNEMFLIPEYQENRLICTEASNLSFR